MSAAPLALLLRGSVRPAAGVSSTCPRAWSSTAPRTKTCPTGAEEKTCPTGASPSSTSAAGAEKRPKTSIQRPAPSSTHDWIGPPNPLSNLRPVVYRVPDRETPLETRLRTLRQETEDWNHDFWTRQNLAFTQEKESFIAAQLKAKGLTRRDHQGRRRSLDSEEMASFYKNFLDENRSRHADYNREWYRRNFSITFLMARVALQNIWRSLSPNGSSTKNGPTAA